MEVRLVRVVSIALLVCVVGVGVLFSDSHLAGEKAKTPDGVITKGEYQNTKSLAKVNPKAGVVHWKREKGVLNIAYSAPTAGWIGIGFGGKRMHGTLIVIGYVDKSGKTVHSLMRGKGHSIVPVQEDIPHSVGITENKAGTIIEVSIPLANFPIRKDGGSDHILAYGPVDNFTTIHKFRTALTLPSVVPLAE